MHKKLFALFLFILLAGSVFAQVTLTANADKTVLTLDDELTLTVRVTGVKGNVTMPQLPSLPAFNVYSREVEQSSINRNTTLTFRYTMLPRFVGQTIIGPITFHYQGSTYKTEPISVRIYRNGSPAKPSDSSHTNTDLAPTQQPDPNLPPLESALASQAYALGTQPFFMVAAVSNRSPYVNQEITLAIRFYYSQNFYDAPYQKPTVSNIFMEDASSSEGTQTIRGTLFRYQEQRYRLMGAAPGPATIGAATVTYHVGSSPLSALDRLFGGSAVSEERSASSAPIPLQIRPLPGGQPSSFYGAVGTGYTFRAEAQPQQVEAGEAVNWTATVYGATNLKPTKDLVFPNVEGFKNYPAASASGSVSGNALNYKTFKTVLVPSASGIYTLPAIEWSFFNPATARYQTLKTQPVSITVTPSTREADGYDFSASHPTGSGFQTLNTDVRYLKTTYAPEPGWLSQLAGWKIINAILLGLLAGCVLFASVGRKSLVKKKTFATAKNQLKKAASVNDVAEATASYLHQKFHINTGSLPLKDIAASLKKCGVRPATVESFSLLWQRLDAARFAPADSAMQSAMDLSEQAMDVLSLIEEETKS